MLTLGEYRSTEVDTDKDGCVQDESKPLSADKSERKAHNSRSGQICFSLRASARTAFFEALSMKT